MGEPQRRQLGQLEEVALEAQAVDDAAADALLCVLLLLLLLLLLVVVVVMGVVACVCGAARAVGAHNLGTKKKKNQRIPRAAA